MDRKLNYCRFELCKKPHEKRPTRQKITLFLKVSKMAIYRKIAKGGPKKNFQKLRIFLVELRKAEKIGNTSRTIA